MQIRIKGFKEWVQTWGLNAEELLKQQQVTLSVSPSIQVRGQLIDLSPAPQDCAVVASAVDTESAEEKEVACFLVDFSNQVLSHLFSVEVGEDEPLQVQFLGQGLLVRNSGDLFYRPLSGTSLQEATLTWQGVELLQRVSFRSLICVLKQPDFSRKLLHFYTATDGVKVDEYVVTDWLKYTNEFVACQADMTPKGVKITLLTSEILGLVKRVCYISNGEITFESSKVIKKGPLNPKDQKYRLRAGGVVENKPSQLALF